MCEPLVPMLFPALGAHVSGADFEYPDRTSKELCGQMANLVAESGGNKGQFGNLVEAICRVFRQHDAKEHLRYVDWQREVQTRAGGRAQGYGRRRYGQSRAAGEPDPLLHARTPRISSA